MCPCVGGPAFFMKTKPGDFMSEMSADSDHVKWYKQAGSPSHIPIKPKALLVISAHWEEEEVITVTSTENNKLVYDYYGFPDYTYNIKYDTKGDKALSSKVVEILKKSGFAAATDSKRGLDHGTFIPLKLMFPEGDIPIVQVSLLSSLDPDVHYRIGQSLAPLLEEGVAIIGSGEATHNLAEIRGGSSRSNKPEAWATSFIDWLTDAVTNTEYSPEERQKKLVNWERDSTPYGRRAHPKEEHLIPLHVCAGAAGGRAGMTIYNKFAVGSLSLACYAWGDGYRL